MIEQFYDLRPEVLALDRKALDLCRAQFAHVEEIRDYNQLKMLRAFTDCGVEARHFWGSSGYGVWDDSRNKLEEVFARCMGAEAALVRPQFMSGTHTLTVALFGLLRTGDTLLAATGRPYDTLEGVIGIGDAGKGCGTLREFGVNYDECPLLPDFTPDYDLIADEVGSEFDVVEPPPGPPACNEEKDQGSRMPPCPYDRIVTLYHEILPELPRVATLTSKRRSWITARWRSVCTTEKVASQADGLDLFRGYFSLVRKSPFLMGLKQPGKGHSRTFKADLEWLMNESNFTKVVEGKYA